LQIKHLAEALRKNEEEVKDILKIECLTLPLTFEKVRDLLDRYFFVPKIIIRRIPPDIKYGAPSYEHIIKDTWKEPYKNQCADKAFLFLYKEAKFRDSDRCQQCFSKKRLAIHHIDFNHANMILDNLITLCNKCHYMIHALEGRRKLNEYFKRKSIPKQDNKSVSRVLRRV
jgi:hypothetical protein